MMLRKLSVALMSVALSAGAYAQSLTFSGNSLRVLEEIPEKSTGLEKIYVLYSTQGVSVSYTSSGGNVSWMRYTNLGGGHAEEVASTQEGNISTLDELIGDSGYIIDDGDRRYCFWITDYSFHRLKLTSAVAAAEQECGVSVIDVEGSGEPIRYYTVNGLQRTLDQNITVEYSTQDWEDNTDSGDFTEISASVSFEYLQPQLRVSPPNYCATRFRISGDRFLKAWNWTEAVETPIVHPYSVDARTFAIQHSGSDNENNSSTSNQIGSGEDGDLGGSAPSDISFVAYTTAGIIHNEWQLTRDPSFEDIDYRFTTQDLDYTFLEEGSHYLRYIGSNADGTCEYISDTYEVVIGESQLKVPNAFSPNGDGVNDEWKVAYRSLLDFQCHIFDRQGHQVAHLTSPDQGWDGKVGGKSVESGVFFYVIEATGTDGKKYKKSGDINVVKYVGMPGNTSRN